MTYKQKDFDRILVKRTYAAGKGSKTGEEFPKGISKEEFRSMQAKENDYRVRAILQAIRHRKNGMLLKEIFEAIRKAVSTVHD